MVYDFDFKDSRLLQLKLQSCIHAYYSAQTCFSYIEQIYFSTPEFVGYFKVDKAHVFHFYTVI